MEKQADLENEQSRELAKQHTIKKFELIEAYVEEWAYKLLQIHQCDAIAFIDCMSNSGVYSDISGNEVLGTPIRVARKLSVIMKKYSNKKAWLCFNDLSPEKISVLRQHLPPNTDNFKIDTFTKDANILLREIASELYKHPRSHYLLV